MRIKMMFMVVLIALAISGCATEDVSTSSDRGHEGHSSAHAGGNCH